jgi:hypothetical protein
MSKPNKKIVTGFDEAEVIVDQLESKGRVDLSPPGSGIELFREEDEWGDDVFVAMIRLEPDWDYEIEEVLRHRGFDIAYEPVFLLVEYVFTEGDYGYTDYVIVESVSGGPRSARDHFTHMVESGEPPIWPARLENDYPDYDSGSIEAESKRGSFNNLYYTLAMSTSGQEEVDAIASRLFEDGEDDDSAYGQAYSEVEPTALSVETRLSKLFGSLDDTMDWIRASGGHSGTGWAGTPHHVVIDDPDYDDGKSSNPGKRSDKAIEWYGSKSEKKFSAEVGSATVAVVQWLSTSTYPRVSEASDKGWYWQATTDRGVWTNWKRVATPEEGQAASERVLRKRFKNLSSSKRTSTRRENLDPATAAVVASAIGATTMTTIQMGMNPGRPRNACEADTRARKQRCLR